jgi:hypothetical protein
LAPSLALLPSLGDASDFALARDDLALAAFFAASVLAGCAGADDIASNSTDTAAHSNRRLERADILLLLSLELIGARLGFFDEAVFQLP